MYRNNSRIIPAFLIWLILALAAERTALSQEWTLRHTMIPVGPELTSLTGFGRVGSVSLNGNVAVVGRHKVPAYVFDVVTGQQLDKLYPARGPQGEDDFGSYIRSSDSHIVVHDSGGNGMLHVYDKSTREELLTLAPRDFGVTHFPGSIAVDRDTLMFSSVTGDRFGNVHYAHFLNINTGEEYLRIPNANDFDLAGNVALVRDEVSARLISADTGDLLRDVTPESLDFYEFRERAPISETTFLLGQLFGEQQSGFSLEISSFDVGTGEHIANLRFPNDVVDLSVSDLDVDGRFGIASFVDRAAAHPRASRAMIFDVTTGEPVYEFPSIGRGGSGGVSIDGGFAVFGVEPNVEMGLPVGAVQVAQLTVPEPSLGLQASVVIGLMIAWMRGRRLGQTRSR